MSSEPLVSVVIPTHDRAAINGDAISSVISQTYWNSELIVSGDGSTDATEDVVAKLLPTARYIKSDVSFGAAHARNRAIGASAVQLIAFLDSDDIWLFKKLERQVELSMKYPGGPCRVSISRGR